MYLLAGESDAPVKVWDALMDVKQLREVDDGLEQGVPVMKTAFPLSHADVGVVLAALRIVASPLDRAARRDGWRGVRRRRRGAFGGNCG